MRWTSLRSLAIAFLSLAGISSMLGARLGAQSLDSLRVGARVSVASPDSSSCSRPWRPWKSCAGGASVIGVIARVSADTLVIQFGPSEIVSVARDRGQRIYISQGRPRFRSAVWSAAVNGLISYWIADLTDASRRSKFTVVGGMAAGGLAVGALFPTERWRKLPTPESPQ